jgi:hypothetical protein
VRCSSWRIALLAVSALGSATAAMADPVAMSFTAALERTDRVDPASSAAKHAQSAARLTEESLSTLNRPIVTVSAQYVEYQKTLSLDLTGPRRDALDSTNSFLDSIPGSVAPEFQAIASDIVGRISQALPRLFAALPSDVSYRFRQSVFRPTVQGILSIYTGGAIARQRAPEVLVQPIFTTGGYRGLRLPRGRQHHPATDVARRVRAAGGGSPPARLDGHAPGGGAWHSRRRRARRNPDDGFLLRLRLLGARGAPRRQHAGAAAGDPAVRGGGGRARHGAGQPVSRRRRRAEAGFLWRVRRLNAEV